MEMRRENTEKRRRKIIHKNAELVRSVKPGQASVAVWERSNERTLSIWKMNSAA